MKIFCLKCKEHREIEKVEEAYTKNGNRKYLKGVCPLCNTKVSKFLPFEKKNG